MQISVEILLGVGKKQKRVYLLVFLLYMLMIVAVNKRSLAFQNIDYFSPNALNGTQSLLEPIVLFPRGLTLSHLQRVP